MSYSDKLERARTHARFKQQLGFAEPDLTGGILTRLPSRDNPRNYGGNYTLRDLSDMSGIPIRHAHAL